MNKSIFKPILAIGTPLTFAAALWIKFVAKAKEQSKTTLDDKIFDKVGFRPVLDHYYNPLVIPGKHLKKSLRADRNLPGINLNDQEQLALLSQFHYAEELLRFPIQKPEQRADTDFYYENGFYLSGDAEYLYNIVRHFKPKRIIEVGSGFSTLMAREAILENKKTDPGYECRQICIEPYEQPWLEKIGVELSRVKIEDIDSSFFKQLDANDILFIDSTHIIRPQGDVLYEFLELLPVLNSGVLIHVHDIFTPKDYLDDWIFETRLLWNEQYLLEAFLTFNDRFKIIGAVNYLSHHYKEELSAKCPVFATQPGREPGAFWMIKV